MMRPNQSERTRSGFDVQTGILRFPEFEKYPHVVAAMTGRNASAFAGDREFNMDSEYGPDHEQAISHRELTAKDLGVDLDDTIWFDAKTPGPVQWVGAEYLGAGARDWSTRIEGVSGIVAQCTNLLLCTLCNDNVSVILIDPQLFSTALVTIDTQNPSGAPIQEAVKLMVERGEADVKEIIGFIAPGLGPCCYTFTDATIPGNRNNLWDVVRTAMAVSGLVRSNIFNPRVCTGCRDSEFFTRLIDGPGMGAGALMLGVMDRDGSLAEVVTNRKSRVQMARATARRRARTAAPSLSDEQKRLNEAMRCPYGQKKVYIRSQLLGGARGGNTPKIALRCQVMAEVGMADEGYNIVMKDYIEAYCAGRFEECSVYQAYQKKLGK